MSVKRESEAQWTHTICLRLVDQCGCLVKPEFAASRYQQPGWPDRYIVHPIWTGHLEFKIENGILSTIQRRRIQAIWLRNPGTVFVVRRGAWDSAIGGYAPNRIDRADNGDNGNGNNNAMLWSEPEELLLKLGAYYELIQQSRKVVDDRNRARMALLKALMPNEMSTDRMALDDNET
jgi:hypothetical protein